MKNSLTNELFVIESSSILQTEIPFNYFILREIEACSDLIASLLSGFAQVLKVKAKCEQGVLIPPGKHYAIELFNMSACVDQYPFYGRCIGFHVSFFNLFRNKTLFNSIHFTHCFFFMDSFPIFSIVNRCKCQ